MTGREQTRRCIGFGEREGICEHEAGTRWGPLWCEKCNAVRLAHISARFKQIEAKFEEQCDPEYDLLSAREQD